MLEIPIISEIVDNNDLVFAGSLCPPSFGCHIVNGKAAPARGTIQVEGDCMRYVVGITMDRRGRDAVSLALTLAQSTLTSHPVELDLVHVIRGVPPERAGSKPEREYQKLCLEDAQKWLAKTHDLIPKTIHSTTSVHFADSMAVGPDRQGHVPVPATSLSSVQPVTAPCGASPSDRGQRTPPLLPLCRSLRLLRVTPPQAV